MLLLSVSMICRCDAVAVLVVDKNVITIVAVDFVVVLCLFVLLVVVIFALKLA